MAAIGLITTDEHGRFRFGAVLPVRMTSPLLDADVPAEAIERAVNEGLLKFSRTDEYLPYQPGSLSSRTFAEFLVTLRGVAIVEPADWATGRSVRPSQQVERLLVGARPASRFRGT
jgi:hypothetical protein